jgi:hypothetical protein
MFNPRAFYSREGVFFQLQTGGAGDWKALEEKLPISERFRRWARQTLALGLPDGGRTVRLTWTLLLDWKAPLTDSVEEPFLRAGTYHIFAVDGLRIGLLAAIGLGLLRLLQLPRALCGALVLPALWFYAGLTGWPASAVRAAIMASVVILGWACRRPMDLINSLFAAAIVSCCGIRRNFFNPASSFRSWWCSALAIILPRCKGRCADGCSKVIRFCPRLCKRAGPFGSTRPPPTPWTRLRHVPGRVDWLDSAGGVLLPPLSRP